MNNRNINRRLIKMIKRKDVILFGAGGLLERIHKKVAKRYNVKLIIDNDPQKWGGNVYGVKIVAPSAIYSLQLKGEFFVITSSFTSEILRQLLEIGVSRSQIYGYQEFTSRGSVMTFALRNFVALETIFISLFGFSIKNATTILGKGNSRYENFQSLGACIEKCDEPISGKEINGCFNKRSEQGLSIVSSSYRYRQAIVYEGSRVIRAKNDLFQVFRLESDDLALHDYSDAAVEYISSRKIASRDNLIFGGNITSGLHLMGFADGNYYHGLVEVLSSLYFYRKFGLLDKSNLIVSESLYKVSSLRFVLQALADGCTISVVKKKYYYRVEELNILPPSNFIVPNLRGNRFWRHAHQISSPESLVFVREGVMRKLSNEGGKGVPERVFIVREGFTRPYNQDELLDVASNFGFVAIDFGAIDFPQQVRIFRSANFIIGPTGAAWTNLLFAHSSLHALVWMPRSFREFGCWKVLANISGVKELRSLFYDGRGVSALDEHLQFYRIAPERFRQSLREFL